MGADRGLSIEEILSNKKLDDIEDKIDIVDAIVDSILVDTATTLDDKLDTLDTNLDTMYASNRVFGIFNTGVPPIGEPIGNAYFVDGSVSASGAGTTWATAVKTIDEGPGLCGTYNDCVFVAYGSYDENANTGGVLCDAAGMHIFGIKGATSYGVQVQNSNGGATAVFTVSADNCEIAGFYIQESTVTVEGIVLSATVEFGWIHDNHLNGSIVTGMENGIHLDGTSYVVVENNYIYRVTNDGIELSGAAIQNILINNKVIEAGDNGIFLNGDAVDNNWVIENYINGTAGTTDTGINIALGDSNMIVGNTVGGCVAAGSDTGTGNVKRDNHGEFGTIASYPVGAVPIRCVEGGVAWGYGAWVQVVAAAGLANDFDIIGIQFLVDTATQYEVAIGIGGAGVEVKIIHVPTDTQAINTEYAFIFDEPRKVRAGTRIAVACATVAGAGAAFAECKVIVRVDPW